jgi:hypothetical protein
MMFSLQRSLVLRCNQAANPAGQRIVSEDKRQITQIAAAPGIRCGSDDWRLDADFALEMPDSARNFMTWRLDHHFGGGTAIPAPGFPWTYVSTSGQKLNGRFARLFVEGLPA